jgi:hypothetical protein
MNKIGLILGIIGVATSAYSKNILATIWAFNYTMLSLLI